MIINTKTNTSTTFPRIGVAKQLRRFIIMLCSSLIIITTAASIINQYFNINRETLTLMRSHAKVIAINSTAALSFNDIYSAKDSLHSLSAIPGLELAAIYNIDQELFAEFSPLNKHPNSNLPAYKVDTMENGFLHIVSPVLLDNDILGHIYLRYDMSFAYSALKRSFMVNLGFASILIIFFLFLLKRFEKKFTRPIAQLHEASEKVLNDADYSIRVGKISNDEFGDLGDVFNEMLVQVEKRDKQLAGTAAELEIRVKERTKELEASKKAAEKGTIAKSKFLASMSHEIRTPLNGVIGMTTLLRTTKLDETQHEYAKTIEYSSKLLLSIINDVLDFSKIEAGKMNLENISFDINKTLSDLMNLERSAAQDKGIYLQLDIADDVPIHLFGDSGRVSQIIMNLLSNAIKFTADGGVLVCVENKSHRKTPESHVQLLFSVNDTGVGISPNKVDSVFEEFQQEDDSTTRHFGGTGLGLAICKKLAVLMGGQVNASSEINKGSVFSLQVCLPIDIVEEAKYRHQQQLQPSLQDCQVLLIGETIQKMPLTHQWLDSWKVSSQVTNSRDKAAEWLDSPHQYDIIIMDESIGISACQFILQKLQQYPEKYHHCRCLLLSTSSYHKSGEHLQEIGFHGFLQRPIFKDQLRQVLLEFIGQLNNSKEQRFIRASSLEGRHQTKILSTLDHARILYAEDNTVNQMVGQKMLSNMGASVDIACNGKEAIRMWSEFSYDVIIMDCHMPIMDGYEATRYIRTSENGKGHIPIIALTANAMQGEKQICIDSGMDEYITKPINIEILTQILDQCLAVRPAL